MVPEKAEKAFSRLAFVMKTLRSEGGCPWDREQDHASLRPYLIEEAYEVLEALDSVAKEGDKHAQDLCDELGDLLFQVVFHARLAEERGAFDLAQVCEGISAKLTRRHPHVFGSLTVKDADEVVKNWEQIKLEERKAKGKTTAASSLSSVPTALPALLRAQRITEKASKYGFDWKDVSGPREKIFEEIKELEEATSQEEQAKEVGDLLFAVVNYARHIGVNAEDSLREATFRFTSRFSYVESSLKEQKKTLAESSLEEMDVLWEQAKENDL